MHNLQIDNPVVYISHLSRANLLIQFLLFFNIIGKTRGVLSRRDMVFIITLQCELTKLRIPWVLPDKSCIRKAITNIVNDLESYSLVIKPKQILG